MTKYSVCVGNYAISPRAIGGLTFSLMNFLIEYVMSEDVGHPFRIR